MWMIILAIVMLLFFKHPLTHRHKHTMQKSISLLLRSLVWLPSLKVCLSYLPPRPDDSEIREQGTLSTTVGRSQEKLQGLRWGERGMQAWAVPAFLWRCMQCDCMNLHVLLLAHQCSFATMIQKSRQQKGVGATGVEMRRGVQLRKRKPIHKDTALHWRCMLTERRARRFRFPFCWITTLACYTHVAVKWDHYWDRTGFVN